MALHFELKEYKARQKKVIKELEARGLDGILMFQQESMYYLTGYDTFGFCFFQCLYLGCDGKLALLTRSADLRQAQHTSMIEDIRIWTDEAGAKACRAAERHAGKPRGQGPEARRRERVLRPGAFKRPGSGCRDEGFAKLEDASRLVDAIRTVKSEAELKYVRKAGRLGDAALKAAIEATHAGADEGDILAAQHNAIFSGGGDYPANEFIIGSGKDALLCRYKSGRRKLSKRDQLTLEFAGVYRHYHAAFMRTLIVGEPKKQHVAMHDAAVAALKACEEQLRPGKTAGDVFDAHARTVDEHGLKHARLNACGYSLGAKFTPSWMDTPMFYHGNPFKIRQNMVFFAHMILMDSTRPLEAGTAMTLARTYITTKGAPEPVSKYPLKLICR
jgi:Xaa-Pro dipeptidase